MKKLFLSSILVSLACPAMAVDTTGELNLSAAIPYEAPQLIFESAPSYSLKLDGTKEVIPMCIYDGSVDASAAKETQSGMQIRFNDNQTSQDGPRVNQFVYSIGLNGKTDATVNERIDLGMNPETPGWLDGTWDWGMLRGQYSPIAQDYGDFTINHEPSGSIKSKFKCLPFNLAFYPIGDPNKPKTAARPRDKLKGHYSGVIAIDISVFL
jgi:hypothetical protein